MNKQRKPKESIATAQALLAAWRTAGEAEARRFGLRLDKEHEGTFTYTETTICVQAYVNGCIATYREAYGML